MEFGVEMSQSNVGLPLVKDGEYVRHVLPFLKMFYDSNMHFTFFLCHQSYAYERGVWNW